MPYDPATPAGQVRLLLNDTNDNDLVFTDPEITAFLAMENQVVKLAVAQALDTIADDEALTAKVISNQGLSTDGPAVAASLQRRATSLRAQYLADLAQSDDDPNAGFFQFTGPTEDCWPWSSCT